MGPAGDLDYIGIARDLSERGVLIVGIPKIIGKDVYGTDETFGFDTAVSTATEAIDRLHTTAEAHHRVMVLEGMGRDASFIAYMQASPAAPILS